MVLSVFFDGINLRHFEPVCKTMAHVDAKDNIIHFNILDGFNIGQQLVNYFLPPLVSSDWLLYIFIFFVTNCATIGIIPLIVVYDGTLFF